EVAVVVDVGVDHAQRDEPPVHGIAALRGDLPDPFARHPGERAQRIEVEVEVRVVHGILFHGYQDDAAACSRRYPTRPVTSSGTRRPMAPLEYTLTITLPSGSSTKPVDCRYSGSSLTNAPVSSETARASALCPSGKVRPCLAVNSAVVCSSSTQSAATWMPAWFRESPARWNARSWAVQ